MDEFDFAEEGAATLAQPFWDESSCLKCNETCFGEILCATLRDGSFATLEGRCDAC